MLNDILNLLFPRLCYVCAQGLSKKEEHLCFACKRNLPISGFPPSNNNPTAKVFRGRVNISWGYSLMEFQKGGISQKILHALKYQNAENISRQIIPENIFETCFNAYLPPENIVPIPLHPRKKALRGFNQAEAVARSLSNMLSIKMLPELLSRTQFNKSQTFKNKYERHTASEGIFKLNGQSPSSILLVDDVITTGATLNAAMDCFPKSTQIAIFTLARA